MAKLKVERPRPFLSLSVVASHSVPLSGVHPFVEPGPHAPVGHRVPDDLRSQWLVAYFRSGWAFFIPYLAAYLLYAAMGWPVNPAHTGSWVPSLLHVYWALHAAHLILAGIALRAWWKGTAFKLQLPTSTSSARALPSTADRLLSTGYSLLPWLCLALIFWIPGIYLEWPSDPWEHLRRINEWRVLDHVTAHSSWKKSSYFLPYSLTAHTTDQTQLSLLNLYYTGVCLLLSWQYYRLAQAIGLDRRASFIFVLLNALAFGNNIFSFYRYYGLSSSILAQIGAVTLTRLALEVARNPQLSVSDLFRPQVTVYRLSLIVVVPALLALITFNHVQGLGIAGLGVLAVIVWRLIEWRRAMILWAAVAAVLLSIATVLWFPRHPALDAVYRPQGWLTAWYGFNLFAADSPAFGRSWQILGTVGVADLGFALWLILRGNHAAGWLTLMPVCALILPVFAVPFANAVSANQPTENIIIFHRMLFAVPLSLGTVVALARLAPDIASASGQTSLRPTASGEMRFPLCLPAYSWTVPIFVVVALLLPPGPKGYARFWQSMQTPPGDLQLVHEILLLDSTSSLAKAQPADTLLVSGPLERRVRSAFVSAAGGDEFRRIHAPLNAGEFSRSFADIRCFPRGARLEPGLRTGSDMPPGFMAFSFPGPDRVPETRLIENPTSRGSSWQTLSGTPVEITAATGNSTIVRNPPGRTAHVFAARLIGVDHGRRYRLTVTLRQTGSASAINYLAVAWYDAKGNLLDSNCPPTSGAGLPAGWINGTYSYFGLAGQPGSPDWTTYAIEFGPGEAASIPTNAAGLRIGALLNYNGAAGALIELKDILLLAKPGYRHAVCAVSSALAVYSPASLAALLSGHWSPQKVASDHAGLPEIQTAIAGRIYERISTVSAPGGG